MRRLHLIVGLSMIVVFLLSGQAMSHHEPHLAALSPEIRMLFRSRHIYLLAAALVNVMPGIYLDPRRRGWRRISQRTGSVLLIVAPILLPIAFVTEPDRGLREKMRFSRYGIIALALGTIGHLIAAIGTATSRDESAAP